jgi:proton-translocating NADH-quinone oxidoreductase chain M
MLLTLIFSTLIGGIFLISLIDKSNQLLLKIFSLSTASLALLLSALVLANFDSNAYYFQEVVNYTFDSNLLNLSYSFGLDGISVHFFFLSSLLVFLCILFIWDETNFKDYAISLLVIELLLLLIFSVLDLLLFYIFFEAILIPMYLIIGVWGSRERKIRAAYLFFFYTLCGSLALLIGILYIYNQVGTFNLEYLLSWNFSLTEQLFLWFAFFFSFASKIPMFPFHIWLPEAHVEAPTVGSVLLAGILLKLGVYGFLRFSLTLFSDASLYFAPLVYLLSIVGIVYASLSALRQTDMKRIIAYSSIAHMNLVTLGIFSFNVIGLEGSIIQSISHGFVSGGMFLLIGILYDRYHSRFLYYYGGIVHFMPIYAALFLIFTFANIAIPGTSSFTGEFLLLTGIYKTNAITAIISALGVILCGGYSLWLYNRIVFGNIKINYTLKFTDISFREFSIMFPLFLFIFIMGIYPTYFLSYIHLASNAVCLINF